MIQKNIGSTDIANGFCKYFSEVSKTFAEKIPLAKHSFDQYLGQDKHGRSLFLSPTDPQEINTILVSLKPKQSCGHDGISTSFLKSTKDNICEPLSILINKSMETGYVPNIFKTAKVIQGKRRTRTYKLQTHIFITKHIKNTG